eukprot:TRINITY_DN20093_c0_g1_i4.p1 TRINITY_DN20093_c0_g1~~TRINITY_DN20093_c0_g1_i4.p1  ORF type:complete len:171 (+),score=59.72 TRINITY_DN20093_c0_g1_i4:121-633(+)
MLRSLVGSEMCIRDRYQRRVRGNPLVAMAEGAERFGLLCAQLRRIYDALDTNANGRLSKVEMRAAVDKCAAAADEADDVPMEGADRHVQALFQHLDLDQDGDISFEEVLAGFRSMPESPDDLEAALADQPEEVFSMSLGFVERVADGFVDNDFTSFPAIMALLEAVDTRQ